MSRAATSAAVFGLVCFWGVSAQAQDAAAPEQAEFRHGIIRLLDVGWKSTTEARLASREQYDALSKTAPGDERLTCAFALVLMKQRRYREAAGMLDKTLRLDPDNLTAWRAKTWLSVLSKDYAAALVEMDKLGKVLSSEDVPETAADYREAAAALGRLFGFLEGPARSAVADLSLDQQRDKIAGRLPTTRRTAFEEARKQVAARVAALEAEIADAQDEDTATQVRQKEEGLAALAQRREEIAAELAETGPRRDKLRSELSADLETVDKEQGPLRAELTRLEFHAAQVLREIVSLEDRITRLHILAEKEKDPARKALLLREADRLDLIQARYRADLAGIRSAAATAGARAAALERRRQQLQAAYQAELGRLAQRAETLRRQQRRLEYDEKDLRQPATGGTPRVNTLQRKAKALTTYDSFPLEAEKQRLLDRFQ